MKEVSKKILPEYFKDVKRGIKTFEVRKDEDDIQVGDILMLEEWKPDGVLTGGYTGRCVRKRVKYVLRDIPQYGLKEGYCIIGLEDINNGWIPCNERLPEDCDNRFYMCIVENHEEDLPMFCQYDEEYGFGFWHDIYDEHTLGFVDSEFRTNEELGYEKVVAWQPLPDPYVKEGDS